MTWKTLLLAIATAAFIGGCMPKDHDANQPPDVDKSAYTAEPLTDIGPTPGQMDPGTGGGPGK